MAREHPLAARESVSLDELADYAICRLDGWPRELHETLFPATTTSGRPIRTVRIPPGERTFLEIAHRVSRQELVFPTVASAQAYGAPFDLAYVPITGLRPVRSALVWRRRERDPKLREFIRIARDVLRAPQRKPG